MGLVLKPAGPARLPSLTQYPLSLFAPRDAFLANSTLPGRLFLLPALRIHEETERGDNDSIKKKAEIPPEIKNVNLRRRRRRKGDAAEAAATAAEPVGCCGGGAANPSA